MRRKLIISLTLSSIGIAVLGMIGFFWPVYQSFSITNRLHGYVYFADGMVRVYGYNAREPFYLEPMGGSRVIRVKRTSDDLVCVRIQHASPRIISPYAIVSNRFQPRARRTQATPPPSGGGGVSGTSAGGSPSQAGSVENTSGENGKDEGDPAGDLSQAEAGKPEDSLSETDLTVSSAPAIAGSASPLTVPTVYLVGIRTKVTAPIALLLAYPVIVLIGIRIRRRRHRPFQCVHCSYDLTGNTSGVCPECGNALEGQLEAASKT